MPSDIRASGYVRAKGVNQVCEEWIAGMLDVQNPYPARGALCVLYNTGFSDHAIKRARLKLGIRSEQRGRAWYWTRQAPTGPTAHDLSISQVLVGTKGGDSDGD